MMVVLVQKVKRWENLTKNQQLWCVLRLFLLCVKSKCFHRVKAALVDFQVGKERR